MLHLDNGEKQAILHPEIVAGNELIVTTDDHGKTIMIAPEAVTSIEFTEDEAVIAGRKNKGKLTRIA